MNFPYETEKSYLYGGNCLIMEVNPSVPNKPISKKSRIFASDYQYMETDIITVSDFEMRPVDYMLARSIEHAKAEPFQWKKEKFTKRSHTLLGHGLSLFSGGGNTYRLSVYVTGSE